MTPTDSGWQPGIVPLPLSEVATGMPRASASATTSFWAPDQRTPPPATMSGRSAFCSNSSAARMLLSSGSRTEGRNAGIEILARGLHRRRLAIDLALVATELQMHRPRRSRNGDTEGLAQHVGEALDCIDSGVELRHRLEGGNVVDLLVGLLEVAPVDHVPQ